jgi:hypothetical protein
MAAGALFAKGWGQGSPAATLRASHEKGRPARRGRAVTTGSNREVLLPACCQEGHEVGEFLTKPLLLLKHTGTTQGTQNPLVKRPASPARRQQPRDIPRSRYPRSRTRAGPKARPRPLARFQVNCERGQGQHAPPCPAVAASASNDCRWPQVFTREHLPNWAYQLAVR